MPCMDDLDDGLLQRIVNAVDTADLFLLRQVSNRWRACVIARTQRIRLDGDYPLAEIGTRFPNVSELHLTADTTLRVKAGEGYNNFGFTSLETLEALMLQLPRLTSLVLTYCSGCTGEISPAGEQTLARLTSLVSIGQDLRICELPFITALCSGLRRLVLSCVYVTWGDLRAGVAQLAGTLLDLDLRWSILVDDEPPKGLLILNTGRLQSLQICLKGGQDRSQLAAITSLTALRVYLDCLEEEDAAWLTALTQLSSLSLHADAVEPPAVAELTRLSRLAHLGIISRGPEHGVDVGDEAAEQLRAALAALPGLASLDIACCDKLEAHDLFTSMPQLTRLRTLTYVPGCGILAWPERLLGLTQLRDLFISAALTDESQLRHLFVLTKLTRLDLELGTENREPPGERLRWLPSLAKLQELSLRCPCWHAGLPRWPLAQLPALRRLQLRCDCRQPIPLLGDLALLERLPLEWLRLPRASSPFQPEHYPVAKLPPRLRAPFLRGQRPQFVELPDDFSDF